MASSITTKITSRSLFSGAADTMRTAVGGYREYTSGTLGESYQIVRCTPENVSRTASEYLQTIAGSNLASEASNSESMVVNKKMPVRLAGISSINDDNQWKAMVLGGTYGAETYEPIYAEGIYSYDNFSCQLPYTQMSASVISSGIITDISKITYEYNHYLSQYQAAIENIESELLLPNCYYIASLAAYSDKQLNNPTESDPPLFDPLYPEELVLSINREGEYSGRGTTITNLLGVNYSSIPNMGPNFLPKEDVSTLENYLAKYSFLTTAYLSSSYINVPLSASTEEYILNDFQNLLFDTKIISELYLDNEGSSMRSAADTFPYYVKLSFPTAEKSTFGEAIYDINFEDRFLKTLYTAFSEQLPEVEVKNTSYGVEQRMYSGSESSEAVYGLTTATQQSFREIDYLSLLRYCCNTHENKASACAFVGPNNFYRYAEKTLDQDSQYRFLRQIVSVKALNQAINYLSSAANFAIDEITDVYGVNSMHAETVAYRVQKIGGSPQGDSRTQNTLQNFWLANPGANTSFSMYDTQVKFGTNYTYQIYAYVLTVGFEYQLSDLRLTRHLGDATQATAFNSKQVLEFYDPFSSEEESVAAIYPTVDYLSTRNPYTTEAQILSLDEYLADFYITYQPTIKIIEVPIDSKTLQIMDNPCPGIEINAFQMKDASRRIGFHLLNDSFQETTFPSVISSADDIYKMNYMHAKDMLEEDHITQPSRSPIETIEVYRINKRPTSIRDFDGALFREINLRIKNSKYSYKGKTFIDKIPTDHKFYYLFRGRNAIGSLGYLSPIYETELVNDGGYIFAVFNTLSEADLDEDDFIETSHPIKKLLQLEPNYRQVELDFNGVDYEQTAESQISNVVVGSAEDLIWDKTFKIRLTSKKTGKKIDLNITYNLESV